MPRILVTDDDAPMRTFLTDVLRQAGHVPIEARNAREALELHHREPADLIVTDMLMKEMDGTELLRRVRAASPHTPVVGISGAGHGRMYLNMAKMLGAEAILAKPFSATELLGAVNAALAAAGDESKCQLASED